MAQLAINRFDIPNEIQSIIKEFALITIERKRIIEYHKKIFYVLTNKLYHTYPSSHYNMIIVYEIGQKHRWFSVFVCVKCGNYKERFYNNITCRC